MPKLILVKHAPPEVEPGVPPERWSLSDKGKALCAPLAEQLRAYAPAAVISSTEPKARQTAERVATALGVPCSTADGLHEHDRSDVPHMRSGEFISMMELLFRRPADRVLGRESADEALARFERAVRSVLDQHEDGAGANVAIFSHGTVIALLAARHGGGGKPFELWRRMGLPSFVVMDAETYAVERVVERV